MSYDNPVWIGLPWAQDLAVEGLEPGDRFRVAFCRSAEGAQPVILPDLEPDEDGTLRLRLTGAQTASWTPGLHAWQMLLVRGQDAALLTDLPVLSVSRSLMSGLFAGGALAGPAGLPLRLQVSARGAPEFRLSFNKGLKGDAGEPGVALAHVHVQAAPSAEWTVAHGLGRRPLVQVTDTSGSIVEGDVEHASDTTTVLRFSAPFAGEARFL